jgi:hypothetical protein
MSEPGRIMQWAARIEALPRLLRIALTLVITVLLVFLVWALLAELVGGGIVKADPSPALTFIVALLGMLIYGACWAALVGFENKAGRTWHAGPSAVYALAAGGAALVVIVAVVVVLLA